MIVFRNPSKLTFLNLVNFRFSIKENTYMTAFESGPALAQHEDVFRGSYAARTAEFVAAGRQAALSPASSDTRRVAVLMIDDQYDFIQPEGALPVPGAREDSARFLQWFYTNVSQVSSVFYTLDTHIPLHIFSESWWRRPTGGVQAPYAPDVHPDPYTVITIEDVEDGRWEPIFDPQWSRFYVQALREKAKKELMIWPYHCIEGTEGHMLLPPLAEAIAYHSSARMVNPVKLEKGRTPRTEYYGAFGSEVPDPQDVSSGANSEMMRVIMSHDLVYVAGQAKSHCVLESMRQLVTQFADQPQILSRLRLLRDCTSSVEHPVIDFDSLAEGELAQMERQGVRLVLSTDPIG
jgi:nicotinamidase/pyrazinamidase